MRRSAFLGLAALLVVAATLATTGTHAHAQTAFCDPSGVAASRNGDYLIQNEVTGAATAQCLEIDPSVEPFRHEFTITQSDHHLPPNGPPAAFPSIFLGCYNGNCSPDSDIPLPAQVDSIVGLHAFAGFDYVDTGVWTAGHHFLLDPTPRTDGQNEVELKVLSNLHGPVQPEGTLVDIARINMHDWEVWHSDTDRQVITYVNLRQVRSQPPQALASVHLHSLLDDAIGRGYLDGSWYVTSLQAGFEVWRGGTDLTVTTYQGVASPFPPPPPPPPPLPLPHNCTATPTVVAEWEHGYVVSVALFHHEPTDSWQSAFLLPPGHQVVASWGAEVVGGSGIFSEVGARALSLSRNSDLSTGNVHYGFQVRRYDSSDPPSDFFSCTRLPTGF